MKKTLILLLFIAGISSRSHSQIIPKGENFRMGLRVGVGITTIRGGELENPTSKRGFVAGAYARYRLNRMMDFSTGVEASFRGSNFNNGDDAYYQVALVYTDFPALFMIKTGAKSKLSMVFGYQASALLKSSIFVKPDPIADRFGLPLKQMDHMGVIGVTLDGEITGLNFYIKYSLRDINSGVNYPDIRPAQGKGQEIRNLAFEIGINF